MANENCPHRRFGVVIESSLAIGLAMCISMPRRRAVGKGWSSPAEEAAYPTPCRIRLLNDLQLGPFVVQSLDTLVADFRSLKFEGCQNR